MSISSYAHYAFLSLEGVSKGHLSGRQAAEPKLDHGNVDPCLRGCAQGFVVLTPAPAAAEPGAGARHPPSAGQYLKLVAVPGAFHDFQDPAGQVSDPLDQLAGLAGSGPHPLQPRPLPLHLGHHQLGAITVLQVCRMDHHGQHQPHGIHYEVALATLDFLAGVIASGPPFAVVFTVWLSIMAALGVGWRPSAARTTGRREACTRSPVPSRVQRRKYLYRVCPGGRSCGTRRQAQPLRSTYRMPCTTSRRSTVRGRPPGLAAGSRGAHRAHWASLRSLEYRSRVMSMQVYGVGVLPIQ